MVTCLKASFVLVTCLGVQVISTNQRFVFIFNRKNLQNATYPEIVFCYIAQKFAYFILPHIVLYFIFRHGFFVGIVLQRAHEDAHLFCLYFFPVTYFVSYFVLTHKLIILFLFWHKTKVFHFTAPSKGLFCFNALVVKLYLIVSHHVSLVFCFQSW
jgi:hypothetical protein